MILPDDDSLAEENYVAYATIQQSRPDAETTHKILSAIMDDHLIIKVTERCRHQWLLTLTVMEHIDNRVIAIAVWEKRFGPFLTRAYAYGFAEKYLRLLCKNEGIPFREVRCEN